MIDIAEVLTQDPAGTAGLGWLIAGYVATGLCLLGVVTFGRDPEGNGVPDSPLVCLLCLFSGLFVLLGTFAGQVAYLDNRAEAAEIADEHAEASAELDAELDGVYGDIEVLDGSGGEYEASDTDLSDAMTQEPDGYARERFAFRDVDGELIEDAYLVREPQEDEDISHTAWIEVPAQGDSDQYVVYAGDGG